MGDSCITIVVGQLLKSYIGRLCCICLLQELLESNLQPLVTLHPLQLCHLVGPSVEALEKAVDEGDWYFASA